MHGRTQARRSKGSGIKTANSRIRQNAARPNSKAAKVLSLLQRAGGVTISALMKATEWQAHSVRGFLSGTVSKRMGLKLTSTRSDGGERVYSVSA